MGRMGWINIMNKRQHKKWFRKNFVRTCYFWVHKKDVAKSEEVTAWVMKMLDDCGITEISEFTWLIKCHT